MALELADTDKYEVKEIIGNFTCSFNVLPFL